MPFIPMGISGVTLAAAQVFFSFIGFDTAATAGEEAKNPKRDLPRAIILSLIIVTTLYVVVALAAIGAKPWEQFEGAGGEAVLSTILEQVTGATWPSVILSIGAVISIFSVVPRRDVRADPNPVRDGSRRAAAASLHEGQSEDADSGHEYLDRHRSHRDSRGLRPIGCAGQRDEHRNAVCVHPRQPRRDHFAPDASRPAAVLQSPGLPW